MFRTKTREKDNLTKWLTCYSWCIASTPRCSSQPGSRWDWTGCWSPRPPWRTWRRWSLQRCGGSSCPGSRVCPPARSLGQAGGCEWTCSGTAPAPLLCLSLSETMRNVKVILISYKHFDLKLNKLNTWTQTGNVQKKSLRWGIMPSKIMSQHLWSLCRCLLLDKQMRFWQTGKGAGTIE